MKLIALIAVLGVAGCATEPSHPTIVTQEVKIAVPVPCKVEWPERPTSNLGAEPAPAGLYLKATKIMRELEDERAYRRKLEVALTACTTSPAKAASGP